MPALASRPEQEESLETQDSDVGHVLTMLTDPYTGGGAMQGASSGIGIANRLWLFTDRLPFKVRTPRTNHTAHVNHT